MLIIDDMKIGLSHQCLDSTENISHFAPDENFDIYHSCYPSFYMLMELAIPSYINQLFNSKHNEYSHIYHCEEKKKVTNHITIVNDGVFILQ